MLDALLTNLIGSLADMIVSPALAMASDHQERRDTLADLKAKASQHVGQFLTGVVEDLQPAVRNRYQEWLAHPRLGHEPLAAELRNAEIGLNEAVMALRANPSSLNQALAIGESIRLTAISEVLGAACIYDDAAKRQKPVTAKRAAKAVRAGDKRLNRRVPVIDDVPDALRPVVARLGADHPERAGAIEELEAARGGAFDGDGIATRLAALVAQAGHQDFVGELAAQAAASNNPTDTATATTGVTSTPSSTSTPSNPTEARRVGQPRSSIAPAIVAAPRTDSEIMTDIAAVANFCSINLWAVIKQSGRYSLQKLKRGDINAAFDRVAEHPEMQDALAQIHTSRRGASS
jgi:hypothetical protein